MKQFDIGDIRSLIPQAISETFDPEIYRETGFFVVRNVVPQEQIEDWQREWRSFYQTALDGKRKVNPYNPVHVNEAPPEALANIHAYPAILDVLEMLYPDLAIFMQRFVIKDSSSRTPVFPHGDFAYDYGWPEKTTCFIPLSPSNSRNGGISFYPGTHHFGYMGDAGEVNTNLLRPDWPLVCPDLEPGDIALCHTCTWHCSPAYESGPDRILVQATYQPSSDPSSTALLRGTWQTRYRLSEVPRDQFFTRCRSSRMRELQTQIDRQKEDVGVVAV
jgi:hypothetical protein